jgi:hypothetical protein
MKFHSSQINEGDTLHTRENTVPTKQGIVKPLDNPLTVGQVLSYE